MNTGCFKCDKAQWDADGCTCKITGLLVGNAERGCEHRKGIELKPCPFCGGKAANCTKQYDGHIYRYRIQCDNAGCACRTPWLCYQEDAAEAWNRRNSVDEKKLSCHFEHCKEALELIQDYKAENAMLREFNDKIYDVLAKRFGSPCNCNYAVDEYMRKNGGCDDCGVEVSDKECWSRYIQTKLIGDEPNGI